MTALEYRHLPALRVLMPAGAKVVVKAPYVRRGMLLLQPGNLEVLGGQVRRAAAEGRAGGGAGWVAAMPQQRCEAWAHAAERGWRRGLALADAPACRGASHLNPGA